MGLNRKNILFRLFKSGRIRCRYCGRQLTIVSATIEHIIPVSSGGKNNKSNLDVACKPCNQWRGELTQLISNLKKLRRTSIRPNRIKTVESKLIQRLGSNFVSVDDLKIL